MGYTLNEMREQLKDMQAELQRETSKGYDMARNKDTALEEITKQSELIDNMQARIALMKKDVDQQEERDRDAVNKQKKKTPGVFSCAGDFFRAVHDSDVPGGTRDSRLARVRDSATGANETTSADGGYLVPPEYADGILEFVGQESVLYPQARRVQIEGNRLIEVYLNEYNRADTTGSGENLVPTTRNGGVLAYWTAEAAQYTAARAAFAERTTNLLKMTAYCPVTEELLQDYAAIEGVLNNLVGKAFSFKIDDAILNGNGNGAPLGILATSNTASQNNAALVTVAKETGQTADTVVYANILKMYNAMIAQNRSQARWYINQDLETVLMQLLMQTGTISSTGASAVEDISGTTGIPIYMPPGAYGNDSAMLLGRPVQPLEQCAALGDKGDIVLADMSQYLLIERAGVTKQSSMHIRFDYDETVFKFTWRVGGRPDWMNTVTPYKGTTSRSPYVCLAERA